MDEVKKSQRNGDADRYEGQRSTGKTTLQVKEASIGKLIGNIPPSRGRTFASGIKFLGGEILGGHIFVGDEVYAPDEIVMEDRSISGERVYTLIGETYHYSDAESFARDCAPWLGFMDPEASEPDKELIRQLKILWHVVQDPVLELIDNFGVSMENFAAEFYVPQKQLRVWICGKEHMPAFARMLMAEIKGVLKIRYLV